MAGEERGGFVWYELMTTDIDAAREFYRAVVGWEIAEEGSAPGGEVDYRMIGRSEGGFAGGALVLSQEMRDGGAEPGWFGYVHTPDVDASAARMVEAGGTIFIEPHSMEGVGRMAFLTDPQGAPIYLMDPAPPPDQPDAQSDVFSYDKAQHVRWNELQTSDPTAAIALYGELLGWRQDGAMPMGELGEYQFLYHGDGMIGAVMPLMPDMHGSRWQYYFGVEDIDRAAQAVTDGGGSLDGGVHEIPGGEYSVHCIDPQGAAFGLVGPRKE
ncbi:VOC family protein [Qipengyuania spongiae]|uniref:VOC family protein n=1 Tax=Qipengyuania spongiae TaxID=2909673 RepID=A0ABY5SZ67_9SPHN|nr:VOC family protein [Qipengyuania spongiae]UVI39554.1 VOC family protein [Qipengyuania spongiae]